MPARLLRWTVCLVLVLGGTACGGGDDEGTSDASPAAGAPSAAATAGGGGAASESSAGGSDDGGTGDSGGGGGTYTVRSGDTLSSIARELDTTVEAIVRANDIADPDVIDVGQELTIPSG